MKAINKRTNTVHAINPVMFGYQVCSFPSWESATIEDVKFFSEKEFNERFVIEKGEYNNETF